MSAARLRLGIAATLFIAWIGWLAFLVATTSQPIVLSRPQFLFSTADVIAQVDEQDGKPVNRVTVEEVHWADRPDALHQGETITVVNLGECTVKGGGWDGAGQYILPLVQIKGDEFKVAEVPLSPGFDGFRTADDKEKKPVARYRIYRLTPETRHQLDTIQKPEHSLPVE